MQLFWLTSTLCLAGLGAPDQPARAWKSAKTAAQGCSRQTVQKQPGSVNMGVFNRLFNPKKLRETLNIGICGIYKLKTPASSEEGFHSARQRGDFQAARQTEVSFTQLKAGIRTLIKTPGVRG